MNKIKLKILLRSLRITCKFFEEDEYPCKVTENEENCHVACNCNGDINHCDLPEKFWGLL